MAEQPEITERERETSTPSPALPQTVVWQLLRAAAREREGHDKDTRRRTRELQRSFTELADDLAMALHKLREFVRFSGPRMVSADLAQDVELLCAITDRFSLAFERAGVDIIDPIGRPYTEVAELVDLVHVEPTEDLTRLVVTTTVQAGLRLADGELVRRATVQLGAPRAELDDHRKESAR
ncbi:MAG: hypothetical protein ACRDRI_02860 [Pseudonocardiaceae bacterium]